MTTETVERGGARVQATLIEHLTRSHWLPLVIQAGMVHDVYKLSEYGTTS